MQISFCEVLALHSCRSLFDQFLHQGPPIYQQLLITKPHQPDLGVNILAWVYSKRHLSSFSLFQSPHHIFEGNECAQFSVGHESLGTEQFSVRFQFGEVFRGGEQFLKLDGATFKLIQSQCTALMSASLRRKSTFAPASCSSFHSSSEHMMAVLIYLPKPAGRLAVPLTICSPFLGFTFSLTHTSTDSGKVVKVWRRIRCMAWTGLQTLYLSSSEKMEGRFFWRLRKRRGTSYLVRAKEQREEKATDGPRSWASLAISIQNKQYQSTNNQTSQWLREDDSCLWEMVSGRWYIFLVIQLIESMRALTRFPSSLLTRIVFNSSRLAKPRHQRELIKADSIPLNVMGVNTIHNRILKDKEIELLPIYLTYHHRFIHPGVNRRTKYANYQLYADRQLWKRKEEKKTTFQKDRERGQQKPKNTTSSDVPDPEHQKKVDSQAKAAFLSVFISIVILFMLETKAKKEIRQPSSSSAPNLQPNSPQLLEESTLIAKLFEGLKAVQIKEIQPEKGNQFKLKFEYDNGTHEIFRYNGNINNLLAMIEAHEAGRFERTKVYLQHKKYSPFESLGDAFKIFASFFGIALTIFIFRRMSPDTFMNKLNPKKSYKIEGVRDIKVKFDDVAGMEQAKKEITEFVDFLKHGEKYRQMGAKIPKGALLTGPPGTGKTMLAKATAGQSGVTFFYISGSEFVEIFVGMGASKVRELFNRARMEAPSIIFIDEIDAIGKKRESSRNEEKDSTLNQLLVEMDGFGSHQTVIVLAATNRKDILDNALTRPGRFDRMVEVTLPDIKAREEIFQVHLKPLKVDPNKKLSDIAKRLAELTPGFSGADISNLCNEAAIIAIRRGKTYVEDKDFEDASERITAGYEKKGLSNPQTKRRVAYHEAGHAVCGWFLKGGDPLVKLTIIPRSKGALGYAQYLPKSSYIITKSDLIDQIAIMLGGLTSEEMNFEQTSSGASDDLQRVYQLSRRMVSQFGMGKNTYNITLDEESHVRKESQALANEMDQEMYDLVAEAQKRCRLVLTHNKEAVAELAEMLLEKETINSEDIKSVLGERPTFV